MDSFASVHGLFWDDVDEDFCTSEKCQNDGTCVEGNGTGVLQSVSDSGKEFQHL